MNIWNLSEWGRWHHNQLLTSFLTSPSLPGLQNINKALSLSGLTLGAGLSLTQVKNILSDVVSRIPKEKTQIYCALLKHLRTLAGQQIRNVAVGSLYLPLGGDSLRKKDSVDHYFCFWLYPCVFSTWLNERLPTSRSLWSKPLK